MSTPEPDSRHLTAFRQLLRAVTNLTVGKWLFFLADSCIGVLARDLLFVGCRLLRGIQLRSGLSLKNRELTQC